jgi:type IV pilus assembly protein PilA
MSTLWHYSDRRNQQQGPVDATFLQAAFARGEIDGASLLWREGMPGWQPLASLAAEIGIATSVPPPRPAAPMSGRPVIVAPREGASGWLIGVVVGGFVLLGVFGILAAIAIPAYQDYTLRAKVSEGIYAAAPLKLAVQETWLSEERCPTHEDAQVGPPERHARGVLRSITLGDEGDGACSLTLAFRDVPRPGEDGVLVMVRDGQTWRYRTSLPERVLPASIRGQAKRLD